MFARMNSMLKYAAATMLAVTVATPSAAQNVRADGRWQAWLGCWMPAGTLIRVVGKSNNAVVCVVPTSTPSAVDVLTVSGGKIIDRTHVDTDGQPHALAKEGCTGWQSAKWSPSARRVYLKSEFNCNGAPATHVSAVYAMAGSGDWIDVQGMRVEKNSGVHAVRYREAAEPGPLPEEITQKLQGHTMARTAAMLAVTGSPSLGEVEEASKELDPGVVATWLIEADRLNVETPAPLNAKQLVELADRGVPASVIDVMLALSYPKVLAVNPAGDRVARQNTDSAYTAYDSNRYMRSLNPLIGFDRFGFPIYASESALMYGCSPFMYGPYDVGISLYASQFGCGGYGYGFSGYPGYGGYGYGGYGYGGYGGYGGYFGGGPVVVPQGPGSAATPSHGRVVNGKGYTQGGNGSNDGSANPRSNNTSPSNSSGSAGASAGASAGSSSPPPARTAQPRKP